MAQSRKKKAIQHLVLLVLPAMQGSVLAADFSGLYLGGNFGRDRSQYNTGIADSALQAESTAAGDELEITDRSKRRLAHVWWDDVGYYLTPNFGVEAEYLHLGGMQYLSSGTLTSSGVPQVIFTGQEITSSGPALSLVGRFPVMQWFEFRVSAGDYVGKAILDERLDTGGFQSGARGSHTGSSLLLGTGFAVNIGGHWSVRADYLRVNKTGGGDIGKFSVDIVTGGISFTF